MQTARKFKFETRDGVLTGAVLVYLVITFMAPGGSSFPLALPLLGGLTVYFLVSRLGRTPRDLSDIITVMTVVGVVYTLFLHLLLLTRTALPGAADPYWQRTLYMDGDTRGILFIILFLFNHLTWSFNIKNYLWIIRAPMSFVFLLGILMLTSLRTWLVFPPAILVFLLLIPPPRRLRVVISFVPSLLAALFIMPILGMAVERGQILESIIWVMGGAVLSIVGSVFISLINKTSPYQKAFFFVVFFAFFILFSFVYFYALLAFSTPVGEASPDLLRIVPRAIQDYFQGGDPGAFPGLKGGGLFSALLLGVPWLLFAKDRYQEYRGETDPQHLTFSAGLLTTGALVLLHVTYAPSLLVGWPALLTWGLLGTRLHPPPLPLTVEKTP